jgi:predicted AAA+ superfamily ATPase
LDVLEDSYMYNGSFECDFLVKKENELIAIQVCYELHNGNREREFKGLNDVTKKFKVSQRVLLTYNQEEEFDGVEVIPFWKVG